MTQRTKNILVVGAVLIAGWRVRSCLPVTPEPGEGKRHDEYCEEQLKAQGHREALSWMKEASATQHRSLGELDDGESRVIIENLYHWGAADVQALGIDRIPEWGENSDALVLTLPDDPTARKKLFCFEAEMADSAGFDASGDDHQRYMFVYKFRAQFWRTIWRAVRAKYGW